MKGGFLRLFPLRSASYIVNRHGNTYSAADTGRGTSISGRGNCGGGGSSHGESMSSLVDSVASGVGEGSSRSVVRKLKGALWGSGEMSIESGAKQGDDEGIGGVVTPSQRTGGVVVPSANWKHD